MDARLYQDFKFEFRPCLSVASNILRERTLQHHLIESITRLENLAEALVEFRCTEMAFTESVLKILIEQAIASCWIDVGDNTITVRLDEGSVSGANRVLLNHETV